MQQREQSFDNPNRRSTFFHKIKKIKADAKNCGYLPELPKYAHIDDNQFHQDMINTMAPLDKSIEALGVKTVNDYKTPQETADISYTNRGRNTCIKKYELKSDQKPKDAKRINNLMNEKPIQTFNINIEEPEEMQSCKTSIINKVIDKAHSQTQSQKRVNNQSVSLSGLIPSSSIKPVKKVNAAYKTKENLLTNRVDDNRSVFQETHRSKLMAAKIQNNMERNSSRAPKPKFDIDDLKKLMMNGVIKQEDISIEKDRHNKKVIVKTVFNDLSSSRV